MILQIDVYAFIPAAILFLFLIPVIFIFVLTPFKSIENSSKKLIFKLRPVFKLSLASFLGGIGIILSLILLFHNFSTTLTCHKVQSDRVSIQCNLATEGITIRHQNQTISNLLAAKLKIKEKQKEEDNSFAQPIFITPNKEINLGGLLGSSDIEEVTKIVADINQFIDNSEGELKIAKDDWIIIKPLIYGVSIFTISAILIAALSSSQYCYFDSESQDFTLLRRSYFRSKNIYQAALQKITKVELKTSEEELLVQSVFLHLQSGEKIPLTGIANSYGYQKSLAKSIRSFLKKNK